MVRFLRVRLPAGTPPRFLLGAIRDGMKSWEKNLHTLNGNLFMWKLVYLQSLEFPTKTEGFPLTIIDAAMFVKPSISIKDWIGTCAVGGGKVAMEFCRLQYSKKKKILSSWELLFAQVLQSAGGKATCDWGSFGRHEQCHHAAHPAAPRFATTIVALLC